MRRWKAAQLDKLNMGVNAGHQMINNCSSLKKRLAGGRYVARGNWTTGYVLQLSSTAAG